MKNSILLATLAVASLSMPARADETHEDVCFDAAVAGQKARKSGELKKARDELLRCAHAACPGEVTSKCTDWVAEVDAAMPSVLVAPQDDRGRDVTQGTVRVDGQPRAEAFRGEPIVLEPGAHVLRFEVAGRAPVEQQIVVREYEKNRKVALKLAPLPAKQSAVPFVLGGIGVAAGLAFGGFAIAGALDRQSSHCDTGCKASDYDRVNLELVAADVALGVGVVFLTIAIVDYFVTRPSSSRARASLAPFVIRF